MPVQCCPMCKRRMPSPKLGGKKYEQDVSRAEAAIQCLKNWPGSYADRHSSAHIDARGQETQAIEDEILRLQDAINDPAKLWRIYRRADKAEGYGNIYV